MKWVKKNAGSASYLLSKKLSYGAVMKLFLLLVAWSLLQYPSTARADVIFEPENDFYKQHQSKILYLGRRFTANGTDGSVLVRDAPGARNEVARLTNGDVIYVQYSCLFNGEYWGYTEGLSGWVQLDNMLVLYDYIAFEEDNADRLYQYSGDYAEIKSGRAAVAWSWPGTDVPPLWTYEDLNVENFGVSYAYTDQDGREWGFITYFRGVACIWVCLSDPLNHEIPAFNPAPAPGVWESDTAHAPIEAAQQSNQAILVITTMVAVLAIGTIILIRVLWKSSKE